MCSSDLATEEIGQKIEALQSDTQGAVSAISRIADVIARINDIQSTIASGLTSLRTSLPTVLLGVVAYGASSLRRSNIEPFVKVVFVGLALACLSLDVLDGVWTIRSLRMFADVFVISMIILVVTRRRMAVPLLATGAVTLTTYGWFLANL